MTEQEAIEFLFEIIRRAVIDEEKLTDEQIDVIAHYERYTNGFYKGEEK